MRKTFCAALALAAAGAGPALANDTMANFGTGGLVFVRTDAVAIASEDLFISPSEVRVAYEFVNVTADDIESIVAFPMPDIQNSPYGDVAIPEPASDNFLGFTVEVAGRALTPALEQRAFAAEIDVTAELKAAAVPLNPVTQAAAAALRRVPEARLREWQVRGIVIKDPYDDAGTAAWLPGWTMKSTYWWTMTFPAERAISVKHSYKPSVGGTAGVMFFHDGKVGGPYLDEYRYRYCVDGPIERAVANSARGHGYPPFSENWIGYILKTGAHWGGSTIEKFTLTVDKGSERNLVSFCGQDVKKIGPTTFRMEATNFYPERDLDILVLVRYDNADTRAMPADAAASPGRAAGRPAPTPMATPGADN